MRALILVVLAIAGCGTPAASPPSPSVSATATATATPTLSPSPSPASASPSPAASPTTDASAAALVKTLAPGWRPTTPSVVAIELVPVGQAADARLVAIPLDGGPTTAIVEFPGQQPQVAVRADGSAIAAALGGVVMWEPGGRARWLVPADATRPVTGLAWSPDGSTLYFGRVSPQTGQASGDLGIFRVRSDGTGLERVVAPSTSTAPPYVSVPRLVTDDRVLVWGLGYEGTSVEILDLVTGRRATYPGGIGDVADWRPTQPRALIEHCTNTGCRGLVEWNDQTAEVRRLLADDVTVHGADRDPSGTRVVVARRSESWALDLIDGTTITRVAGSGNAQWPRWRPQGIVYLWGATEGDIGIRPLNEVRLIAPSGGSPRTLYRAAREDAIVFITGLIEP